MKQRIRNEHNACKHEQKKPEKRTKQERKLQRKKELLTPNFPPSSVSAWKTIRHDRFTANLHSLPLTTLSCDIELTDLNKLKRL
jgi:hypothetical protein